MQSHTQQPSQNNTEFLPATFYKQDKRTLNGEKLTHYFPSTEIEPGPGDMNCFIVYPPKEIKLGEKEFLEGSWQFASIHAFAVCTLVMRMYDKDIKHLVPKSSMSQKIKFACLLWKNRRPFAIHPCCKPDQRNAYCYQNDFGFSELVFHSFTKEDSYEIIDTSLSFDIVAHETGHGILFTLVPYFNDYGNLLTFALHEAFGDLTVMFLLLDYDELRNEFLEITQGDFNKPSFLSNMGEYFAYGAGLETEGFRQTLNYVLSNRKYDYHSISQVFTGAIYEALGNAFATETKRSNLEMSELLKKIATDMRRVVLEAYIRVESPITFFTVCSLMTKICSEEGSYWYLKKPLVEAFMKKKINPSWEEKILGTSIEFVNASICGTSFTSSLKKGFGKGEKLNDKKQRKERD